MIGQPCLVATADVLDRLSAASASRGSLDLCISETQQLAAIAAFTLGNGPSAIRVGGWIRDLPEAHLLRAVDPTKSAGVWYRARDDVPLAVLHRNLCRRPGVVCDMAEFRSYISQGWRAPPVGNFRGTLVEDRSTSPSAWTAWMLSHEGVVPATLLVYDKNRDPAFVFEGHWPQDETRNAKVLVAGVGSIGSSAAIALTDYEFRKLVLVDPDRLRPHNLARHRCGPEEIGRFKVDAVAKLIQRYQSRAEVTPLRYDVIEHADLLRPILDDIDVVVCCVDGVAARQAMTHLCSLASTPAVFACVLDDGALGEIVRLPARDDVGCLRCLRRSLENDGSIDPEPSLDLEYGTGTSHRPMTAIAGDMNLMGSLAAKAAASAYLESRGHRDQRWAGDHLVVGLRPDLPFEAPFDQCRVLDVTAATAAPPDPDCPLCSDDRRFD